MLEKALPSGRTAYYWNPPGRDLKAGFALRREKLGSDYGAAAARAEELNQHLDAWRKGRGAEKSLDLQPGYGTLEWMVERYKRSRSPATALRKPYGSISNALRRSAPRQRASVGRGSRCRRENRTGARARNQPPPRSQKMQLSSGRGRGIRTPGPLLPKQVLYQAELCPEPLIIKDLFRP